MPRITRMTTKNTKGKDLDIALTGREIFLGPVGCGKSTHLEAFIIGMQGYLPQLGKTPASTFQIASGDKMVVNLTREDGFAFGMSIVQKTTKHKDGGKTHRYVADYSVHPGEGETKAAERLARIREEIGEFSIMFNGGEFISMSDEQKRNFVFSLSSPEKHGWDQDRIMKLIESDKIRKEASTIWAPDLSVAQNVSAILKEMSQRLTDAKAVKKSKDTAKVEMITARQEASEGTAPDSLQSIRAQLEELRGQASQMESDIAVSKEKKATHQRLSDQMERLEGELQEAKDAEPEDVEEIDKKIEVLTNEKDELVKQLEENDEKRQELLDGNTKRVNALKDAERVLTEETTKRSNLRVVIETIDKVGCPFMKDQCSSDLSGYKAERETEWAASDSRITDELRPMRDQLQQDLDDADAQRDAIGKESKGHNKRIREIDSEIRLQEGNKERCERYNLQLSTAVEKVEGKMASVRESMKSSVGAVDMTMAEAGLSQMQMQIGELEASEQKALQAQEIMRNFDAANVAAEEAEEEVEHYTEAVRLFGAKGIQAEIMGDVIGPITKLVNGLLSHLDGDHEIEFRLEDMNGKEVFQLLNGAGIPYRSLSGGQRILYLAALVVALIMLDDPNVKGLCIEAAELDRENFMNLIKALDDIGTGIDNIMIATCNDGVSALLSGRPDLAEGWNIVKME